MGGCGSGGCRVANPRKKTHQLPHVDINRLRKLGWVANGDVTTNYGGAVIPIVWSQNRGAATGIRAWFSCPQCGRRSGKLYRHHGQSDFGCRHCFSLTYQSSCESDNAFYRSCARLVKLKIKLGDPLATPASILPERPRYMRRSKYYRYVERVLEESKRQISSMDALLTKLKRSSR